MLNKSLHGQCGAGLIEVMIAVLVLSIGMLGMTGLQAWALRNSQSAHERGMVVVQTHFIADAMRADRVNAINGQYDIDVDDTTPTGTTFAVTAIKEWRESLQQTLGPSASGGIDCDGPICVITVQWSDGRGTRDVSDTTDTQTFQTEVEL